MLNAHAFARHYIDSGFNATEAHRRTWPNRKLTTSSRYTLGYKVSKNIEVQKIIATKLRSEEELNTLFEEARVRCVNASDHSNELRALEGQAKLAGAFKDKSEVTTRTISDEQAEQELLSLRRGDSQPKLT